MKQLMNIITQVFLFDEMFCEIIGYELSYANEIFYECQQAIIITTIGRSLDHMIGRYLWSEPDYSWLIVVARVHDNMYNVNLWLYYSFLFCLGNIFSTKSCGK